MKRLVIAEIDLSLLYKNYKAVRSCIRDSTKCMAIVKGNAYGHGDIQIAKYLEKQNVDYFGVACLFEALKLRDAGFTTPILLLGYTDPESVDEAVERDITITILDEEVANAVNRSADRQGKKAKVHVKIDTGMHRLGLQPKESVNFFSNVLKLTNLDIEGMFTHFASSDEDDLTSTHEQLSKFKSVISDLESEGFRPRLIHAANSASTLRLPDAHFDMVRVGKALYGPLPGEPDFYPYSPSEILTLRTSVVQVHDLKRGERVGYGGTYEIREKSRIATIPIGYADGFRRSPQNFGEVLVKGRRVPVVGRVSMDQSAIDVTKIPGVKLGDEVVVLGSQGDETITLNEIASKLGTINYEVTSSLSERIVREYTGGAL